MDKEAQMTLRKNFSTEVSDLETLKDIAAALGFVQTRGKHKGEGSIRRLLEAVANGDVRVVMAQENQAEVEAVEKLLEDLTSEGLIRSSRTRYEFPQVAPTGVTSPLLSEQIIADRR
jgi:hypothetical protein